MYKIKNNFLSLITFLLFLLKISLVTAKQIKILEGDLFNQELQNIIQSKSKLFLIFFARNCEYCGYSVRVLKERVVPHYEDDDEVSFGVVNLDRQSNFWIGLQFNITQIPYIILIENRKMYRFKEQFDESIVVQFINEEKNIEDAFDIPEDIGLYKKINFFMTGIIQKTSNIFNKLGFNNFWSNTFSIILLAIFFIYLVYLEHNLLNWIRKIVNFCLNRKKKKDNNIENDTNSDKKKDNIDEKKKEKKDEEPKEEIKENNKEDKKEENKENEQNKPKID